MSRKGDLLSLENIIKIVFLGVVLLFAFPLTLKAWDIVTGDTTEAEAAKEQAIQMKDKINNLLSKEGMSYTTDSLFIPEKFSLAGFDNGARERVRVNIDDEVKTVRKPDRCNTQTCMCLYNFHIGDGDGEIVNCWDFNQNFEFMGAHKIPPLTDKKAESKNVNIQAYEELPDNMKSKKTHFVIYGDNIGKLNEFYIEKITENGRQHVLITDSGPHTKYRYKHLQKCSQNSDEECQNSYTDEVIKGVITNYCRKDSTTNRCEAIQIEKCEDGKITELCACDGKAYRTGYCKVTGTTSEYRQIDCSQIDECNDYCGGTTITGTAKDCTKVEGSHCAMDPCQLGCNVKAELTSAGTSKYFCQ